MARRTKMRMKFNKTSQLLLVSAASLVTAALMTSCGTNTVDSSMWPARWPPGHTTTDRSTSLKSTQSPASCARFPPRPFPPPVAIRWRWLSPVITQPLCGQQGRQHHRQFMIGSDGSSIRRTPSTRPHLPYRRYRPWLNLFVLDTYQPFAGLLYSGPVLGSVASFLLPPPD